MPDPTNPPNRERTLAGRPASGPRDPSLAVAASRGNRKEPLTTDRIVDTALEMMRTQGYDSGVHALARPVARHRAGLPLPARPQPRRARPAGDRPDRLAARTYRSQTPIAGPSSSRTSCAQMLRPLPRPPGLGPGRDGADPHHGRQHERRRGDRWRSALAGASRRRPPRGCATSRALRQRDSATRSRSGSSAQNTTEAGEEPDHEAIDVQMVELLRASCRRELFPLLTQVRPPR